MDNNDCVIHFSCFWQILAPLTKVGFMVVPNCLKDTVAKAKSLIERDLPAIEQSALEQFISHGHLDRLVRRNRKIYQARRQALMDALLRNFGSEVTISYDCGGLEMLVRFQGELANAEIEKIAEQCHLRLRSPSSCYAGDGRQGEFIIPFSLYDEEALTAAVSEFAIRLKG
jgi:GntR family transcriptional regulator/MocR family aminotransferase